MSALTRRDFLSFSAVAAALGFTALPATAATAKPTCRTCATPTATPTASASGITTTSEPLASVQAVMRFDVATGAALRVSPDGVLHVKALVIHPD